jgi:hypothetical protein
VSVEPGRDIDNVSPALGLGTKYDTELTSWLDYLFDFIFQVLDRETGTYLHHLITTLSSDLIGDLDLDVSLVWDRVQDPQPEADGTVPKQDDYRSDSDASTAGPPAVPILCRQPRAWRRGPAFGAPGGVSVRP